jgi:Zn-dependent protease with chaperone function
MVRRRRLFLSDVLLKLRRSGEAEAVLAREFVHLRGRHREILIGAAILALPLIYRFSHLGVIEGTLPWAIRGPLLVWVTPVTLYLLWRRFERTTDAEAVKISGDPTNVLDAPMQMAQLNLLALYWRRFEQRFLHSNAGELKETPEALTGSRTQTGASIP